MIREKNNSFQYERNGIEVEVNCKCKEDTSVPTLPKEDDGNRFCVDVQSIFLNGVNIYDFIRNSELEQSIITKGEELCFGLFHDI